MTPLKSDELYFTVRAAIAGRESMHQQLQEMEKNDGDMAL